MEQYKRVRRRVLIVFSVFGFIPLAAAGIIMIARAEMDAVTLTAGVVLLAFLLLTVLFALIWLKKRLKPTILACFNLMGTFKEDEREILESAAGGSALGLITAALDFLSGRISSAESASRLSEIYEAAMRCTDEIVWINANGAQTYIIPESWRKYYPDLSLKNDEPFVSCLAPDCTGEFLSAQRAVQESVGTEASLNARIRTGDEEFSAVTIRLRSLQTGGAVAVVAAIHDMDRITRLEKTVQEKYLMYNFVLQAVSDIIYEVDVEEDRYSIVNPGRWNEMFDIPVNGAFSKNRSLFGEIIHPDNKEGFYDRFGNYDHLILMPDRSITYDYRILRKNGDWTWVRHTITCVKSEGGRAVKVIGMIYDINEKKQQEFHNLYNKGYDSLTGSLSRSAIEAEFNSRVSSEHSGGIAVLSLDINGMGKINDMYGYEAGNRLLQQITRILWANQFESCYVSRVGNDNFAVLMGDVSEGKTPQELAEKIITKFRSPITIGAYKIPVSVSVGFAEYGKDAADFSELYKKAAEDGERRFGAAERADLQ